MLMENIGIDASVLVEKLNSYETPLEIANFLRSQDIRGQQRETASCVITNWIVRETGHPWVTTSTGVAVWNVDPTIVDYCDCDTCINENDKSVVTKHEVSEVVLDFVCLFDKGEYPDLVQ